MQRFSLYRVHKVLARTEGRKHWRTEPQKRYYIPTATRCAGIINDLPDVVKGIVKIFADDTKIYARVNNDEEHKILQEDLDNLMKWSDDWLLKFNKSKCKHLHIGRDTN